MPNRPKCVLLDSVVCPTYYTHVAPHLYCLNCITGLASYVWPQIKVPSVPLCKPNRTRYVLFFPVMPCVVLLAPGRLFDFEIRVGNSNSQFVENTKITKNVGRQSLLSACPLNHIQTCSRSIVRQVADCTKPLWPMSLPNVLLHTLPTPLPSWPQVLLHVLESFLSNPWPLTQALCASDNGTLGAQGSFQCPPGLRGRYVSIQVHSTLNPQPRTLNPCLDLGAPTPATWLHSANRQERSSYTRSHSTLETNSIHSILFVMLNKTICPSWAAIDRILISVTLSHDPLNPRTLIPNSHRSS
jgi:hypothetical protein